MKMNFGFLDAVRASRFGANWRKEARRGRREQRRALAWVMMQDGMVSNRTRKDFIDKHGFDKLQKVVTAWELDQDYYIDQLIKKRKAK